MATITIPVCPVDPTNQQPQRVTMEVDTRRFTFEFYYVRRTTSWYINLYNTAGTLLRSGQRVTSWWPLLADSSNPDLPRRFTYVIDTEKFSPEDVLPDTLGRRHKVFLATRYQLYTALGIPTAGMV